MYNTTNIVVTHFASTDREEPIPGYRAGDTPGGPPEDPGREGWIWGTGGLLGIAPDSGEQSDQLIFGFRADTVIPFTVSYFL